MGSNNQRHKQGSVFWQLLRTSLVPGLCTAAILSFLFIPMMIGTARKNDAAREALMLHAVATQLDSMEASAKSTPDQIKKFDWLFYDVFIQSRIQKQPTNAKLKEEIMRDLYSMVLHDSLVEAVSFRFLGQNDKIYGSGGVYDDASYLQEFSPNNVSYAFFTAPEGFSTVMIGNTPYLMYYAPLSFSIYSQHKGEVNLFYKTSKLAESILLKTGHNVNAFRIMTKDETVLWSYELNISEEPCISLQTISASGDYIYEIDVPESVHNQTRKQIMPVVWMIIVLDVLFCVVSAYYFAIRAYKPVGTMMNKFAAGQNEGNEYNALDRIMDRILLETSEVKSMLDQLQPLARQRLLNGLISGQQLLSDVSEDRLATCNISFPYDTFRVLAVFAPISQAESLPPQFQGQKQAGYLMTELISEASGKDLRLKNYVAYEDDDWYWILVNYVEEQDLELFLERLESRFCFYVPEYDGQFEISVGISAVTTDGDQLARCAEQAGSTLHFSQLNQLKGRVSYADVADQLKNQYDYPLSTQLLLSRAVQEGSLENANAILDEIILSNRERKLSLASLRALYSDLVSTVLRSLQTIGAEIDYHAVKTDKIMGLSDIQVYIGKLMEDACGHVWKENHGGEENLDQEILDYVDANLYNAGLSANMIAEKFEKPQVYISRLYKKRKDMNFTDYVNRARIQRAIELITTEGISLNDVYPMVGYVSMSTFRRNFTKFTNKSPGEFTRS